MSYFPSNNYSNNYNYIDDPRRLQNPFYNNDEIQVRRNPTTTPNNNNNFYHESDSDPELRMIRDFYNMDQRKLLTPIKDVQNFTNNHYQQHQYNQTPKKKTTAADLSHAKKKLIYVNPRFIEPEEQSDSFSGIGIGIETGGSSKYNIDRSKINTNNNNHNSSSSSSLSSIPAKSQMMKTHHRTRIKSKYFDDDGDGDIDPDPPPQLIPHRNSRQNLVSRRQILTNKANQNIGIPEQFRIFGLLYQRVTDEQEGILNIHHDFGDSDIDTDIGNRYNNCYDQNERFNMPLDSDDSHRHNNDEERMERISPFGPMNRPRMLDNMPCHNSTEQQQQSFPPPLRQMNLGIKQFNYPWGPGPGMMQRGYRPQVSRYPGYCPTRIPRQQQHQRFSPYPFNPHPRHQGPPNRYRFGSPEPDMMPPIMPYNNHNGRPNNNNMDFRPGFQPSPFSDYPMQSLPNLMPPVWAHQNPNNNGVNEIAAGAEYYEKQQFQLNGGVGGPITGLHELRMQQQQPPSFLLVSEAQERMMMIHQQQQRNSCNNNNAMPPQGFVHCNGRNGENINGNGGNNYDEHVDADDEDEEYHPEPRHKRSGADGSRQSTPEYIPQSIITKENGNNGESDSSVTESRTSNNSSNGSSSNSYDALMKSHLTAKTFMIANSPQSIITSDYEDEDSDKSREELAMAIKIFLNNHIEQVEVIHHPLLSSPSSSSLSSPPSPSPPQLEVRNGFNYIGKYLQVSIYGYCKTIKVEKGKYSTAASYGICFRNGNKLNFAGKLKTDEPQTSITAELLAAERAILLAKHKVQHNLVNINTDSAYILENVKNWIKRIHSTGSLVPENWVEVKHFEEIKRLCNSFEGMKVQWTLVNLLDKRFVEIQIAKNMSMKADIQDFQE